MLSQNQKLDLSKQLSSQELAELVLQIKQWGLELGFQQVGIADTDLLVAEAHLHNWLAKGFHGDMDYMQRHGIKRSRPELLHEGTLRVISVRMDYLPETREVLQQCLEDPTSAYISRYALGRDYHKMLRNRLQKLADKIQAEFKADAEPLKMRAFVDSAPVLEEGPEIEKFAAFPKKVNVGYLQAINRHEIKLRVFERGAGETLACGTGACAAVVSGIRRGLLDSPVKVHTRGGDLQIAWGGMIDGLVQPVIMTGPAVTVFEGETTI